MQVTNACVEYSNTSLHLIRWLQHLQRHFNCKGITARKHHHCKHYRSCLPPSLQNDHSCKGTYLILQVASISTQLYGDVTLLANANAAVTLTMQTKSGCQNPAVSVVSDTTPVYANLNPAELDVDVGQAFGLQVQSQTPLAATPEYLQVGQSFAMEVRVNSASSPLIAYQV